MFDSPFKSNFQDYFEDFFPSSSISIPLLCSSDPPPSPSDFDVINEWIVDPSGMTPEAKVLEVSEENDRKNVVGLDDVHGSLVKIRIEEDRDLQVKDDEDIVIVKDCDEGKCEEKKGIDDDDLENCDGGVASSSLLLDTSSSIADDDVNGKKDNNVAEVVVEKDEDEENSSSSSSSSSEDSSDDDEEEEEDKDVEDGEINEKEFEFCGGSDDEDDLANKGPIKSKNELRSEDLPPVPPVNVSLEPHHSTQAVGTILSIIDSKVIVEGSEKHNPLHEGSILWITRTRQPLGLVDELFGPVKNPYYVVRYNSSEEVPSEIDSGEAISFVPEFANHVLNDKNIYVKGYDASGDNDEEVSEVEFSDDEKEAEYRRSSKQKGKRQAEDQKSKSRHVMDKKKIPSGMSSFRKNQKPARHGQQPFHQQVQESSNAPNQQQMAFGNSQFGGANALLATDCSLGMLSSQAMHVHPSPALGQQAVPQLPGGPQQFSLGNFTCPTMGGQFNTSMIQPFNPQGGILQFSHGMQQSGFGNTQGNTAWINGPMCQGQQQHPQFSGLPGNVSTYQWPGQHQIGPCGIPPQGAPVPTWSTIPIGQHHQLLTGQGTQGFGNMEGVYTAPFAIGVPGNQFPGFGPGNSYQPGNPSIHQVNQLSPSTPMNFAAQPQPCAPDTSRARPPGSGSRGRGRHWQRR